MIYSLTHKELLELKFWLTGDVAAEQARMNDYLKAFKISLMAAGHTSLWDSGRALDDARILEIGTGPYFGLLPLLSRAAVRVGVDPLYPAFDAVSVLADRDGILRVDEPFEHWETNDQFDAILTCNALDHGEMGFYLIPKMWRMLRPGGRLYIHVHLRPPDLLNLLHDHSLTEEQLDKHLSYTDLVQKHRKIYEHDVDGGFCRTLVGIWSKP